MARKAIQPTVKSLREYGEMRADRFENPDYGFENLENLSDENLETVIKLRKSDRAIKYRLSQICSTINAEKLLPKKEQRSAAEIVEMGISAKPFEYEK